MDGFGEDTYQNRDGYSAYLSEFDSASFMFIQAILVLAVELLN